MPRARIQPQPRIPMPKASPARANRAVRATRAVPGETRATPATPAVPPARAKAKRPIPRRRR
jgi:hypothetical protein